MKEREKKKWERKFRIFFNGHNQPRRMCPPVVNERKQTWAAKSHPPSLIFFSVLVNFWKNIELAQLGKKTQNLGGRMGWVGISS